MLGKIFVDTNISVYLETNSSNKTDKRKKQLAKLHIANLVDNGYMLVISTQVLNEFANIAMKKYKLSVNHVTKLLNRICEITKVVNLSKENTYIALRLFSDYQLSWYDALICSIAITEGCSQIISEDLHHLLVLEENMTIINPFMVR